MEPNVTSAIYDSSGFIIGKGEAYSLICAFCWASAVVLFKHAGDSMSAHGLNFVKNIIGVSLLGVTAMTIEGFTLPSLSLWHWVIVVLTGFFSFVVADLLYLEALRRLDAGRTAIISTLYSPFCLVLSIIFLSETIAHWRLIGFVAILSGVIIVTYQYKYAERDRYQLWTGAALVITSMFLMAAGLVAMSPVLDNSGFFWIATLQLGSGLFVMSLFLQVTGKFNSILSEVSTKKHRWPSIIIASVSISYLATIFGLGGLKYAEAPVVAILNETSTPMIVLLAWLFLGESLTWRKFWGLGLTFFGVLCFTDIFMMLS